MSGSLSSLPFEIIQFIGDFLSIVDLMSLRLTCKYLSKLSMILNTRINDKLKDTFSRNIIGSMKKNKIVITGSFLLQLLYNAEWIPNDIDLYIGSEMGYERWDFIATLLKNDFFESNNDGNLHNYVVSRYFINEKTGQKINLVSLDDINPVHYIFKVSDMEIGKVAFCCNKEKLYIKNWNKLIYKYDHIIPLSLITIAIYDGREIRTEETMNESRMYDRMEKYISRGFNITVPESLGNIIRMINNDYEKFKIEVSEEDEAINLHTFLEKYHTDTSILINFK